MCVPAPLAEAKLKCPGGLDVQDTACEKMPQGQKEQCKSDCKTAKQDCDDAMKACQGGKAAEEGHIAEGQSASGGAGSGAGGNQGTGGTQAPNADNMCAGQKANQNRAADGAPIPPAMKKCAASAKKCKDPSGPEAAGKAASNAGENAAENAQRLADAAKMGEQCKKSNDNESKMPSMPQIPQMPQQKDENKTPEDKPWESTVASDTANNTDTDTTVKTDVVKFGQSKLNNDVDMIPNVEGSVISGNTPGGPVGGLGAHGGPVGYGSGGGDITKAGNSAASKGGIGSGASSLGGSDGSKPKDGIAGADIKPESGNNYEVPTGSGGKSVLGLKNGSGSDDEITVAKLAGGPVKGAGDSKKGGSGTAGGAKGSAAGTEGGISIFQMVKHRYMELRKIGEI